MVSVVVFQLKNGNLKWPIKDNDRNDIDLYTNNTLFVPSAPMGLLCSRQIAQQTLHPGD